MKRIPLTPVLVLFLATMVSHPCRAINPTINPGHAGAWVDPGHSGQGIVFELVPTDHQLTAYWFTWNDDGERLWLVGQGPYDGNQAQLQFVVAEGGAFLSDLAVTLKPAGEATVTFAECGGARMSVLDGDGASHELALVRLAPSAGCLEARREGIAEYAIDSQGRLVPLSGEWATEGCVVIEGAGSLSREIFRFDGDHLTIEMTRHPSVDCSGPAQPARIELMLRAAGRSSARIDGRPVPVARFDMMDLDSGETLRQVLYIETGADGRRLTHGVFAEDGGATDADGYPLDLHADFLRQDF